MDKSVIESISSQNSGTAASDASDLRQTEMALLTLRNLSRLLHSTLDIEKILDLVISESVAIFGAESGLVAICCADGISSFRYFKNGLPVPTNGDWTPGSDVPGRVIVKAEPYLSNDVLRDLQVDPGLAAAYGVRNAVSTPMLDSDGEMIGYLEIQNKIAPSGFTGFDLNQLTTIAQIAAQAVKNAMGFQKIAQDAAELEQRVAERTAQLQEINEELDTFAYTVSHDLRAPLRAIQGFADILQERRDQADDPERGEFLARISGAARDMDQMIQDILDYSRLSRQELLSHTVNLNLVIQEAAEILKLEVPEGSLQLEVAGNLPHAKGDHAVLVQVVRNLFSNAVKYVASGVTPKLRVAAERTGDKVRLWVQDNGIGIAQEDQDRIFKVFERLHGVETYKGTGIGLAIARKAMIRLGGQIGVQSRLGEGSRFWIELPSGIEEIRG